jgi:hypothetical protein
MEQELRKIANPRPQNTARQMAVRKPADLPPVDICCIGAVGFYRNLVQPDTIAFTTSLYEIDRILEEKESELTDEELVEQKLPHRYRKFEDVFSKAASDILPPHRPYDHKIEIESDKENALSYTPLREQSIAELQATKQYLVDNLAKGFIEPSQAPFASPILFAKKPNGGLRFCIDYRKLNNMTRKDRYPLPLLNKTLAQINRAKVFIKLNIR